MKRKGITLKALTIAGLLSLPVSAFSQHETKMTLEEVIQQAMTNNQALKLSGGAIEAAAEKEKSTKQTQLPNINLSLSAFYLGDASIYDKDLSNRTTVEMPHFGNSLIVQANQVIYRGGAISNSIEIASLQKQIAELDLQKNQQGIKLLVSGYYLELLRWQHQKTIFEKNIELSAIRLHNIEKMHEQGLVTNNDVIRTKLLILNLEQSLLQVNNTLDILNTQLVIACGLPEETVVIPDDALLASIPQSDNIDNYLNIAYSNQTDILKAKKGIEIAEKSLKIAKSDRMPTISLFAANSLQRPITSSTPALDMYTNGWQAGGSISFNLSSLYKSSANIRHGRIQVDQAHRNVELQEQNTKVAVTSAYLKFEESKKQLETAGVNIDLANENYNITEKKYMNQLAMLVDMLDATNAKLDAELQHANATIGVIFSYFKLLNSTGQL